MKPLSVSKPLWGQITTQVFSHNSCSIFSLPPRMDQRKSARLAAREGAGGVRATNEDTSGSSEPDASSSSDEEFLPHVMRKAADDIDETDEETEEEAAAAAPAGAERVPRARATELSSWTIPTADNGPRHPRVATTEAEDKPKLIGELAEMADFKIWDPFKKFWPIELLENICKASNDRDKPISPPLTPAELLLWLSCTIIMGYNKQPRIEHYWSTVLPGERGPQLSALLALICDACRLRLRFFRWSHGQRSI
jgi:hypothetical protein